MVTKRVPALQKMEGDNKMNKGKAIILAIGISALSAFGGYYVGAKQRQDLKTELKASYETLDRCVSLTEFESNLITNIQTHSERKTQVILEQLEIIIDQEEKLFECTIGPEQSLEVIHNESPKYI